MPLNPLFWLLLVVLGAAAGTSLWARRRAVDADDPVEEGRLAGYSRTIGANVSIDESVVSLEGGHWRPHMLETFHSRERGRLILTLRLDAEEEVGVRDFLERLGREVQARTGANVIYLEAEHARGAVDRLLYAPDGLGWTGHERLQLVWRPEAGELDWQ